MKARTKASEKILKQPYSWVLIPQEGGGYTAKILEFPGCIAEGESAEDAIAQLKSAAESWIAECKSSGCTIPPPATDYGLMSKDERWMFVIDTDEYAGNFERELGGYVMGQVDEWGEHRAAQYIKLYQQECPADPFKKLVYEAFYNPGDDGFMLTPAHITTGPNGDYPYNSVAIHLWERPNKQQIQLLVARAQKFSKLPKFDKFDHRPKILGCRLVREWKTMEWRNAEE